MRRKEGERRVKDGEEGGREEGEKWGGRGGYGLD